VAGPPAGSDAKSWFRSSFVLEIKRSDPTLEADRREVDRDEKQSGMPGRQNDAIQLPRESHLNPTGIIRRTVKLN
jgi:hypothetical protein